MDIFIGGTLSEYLPRKVLEYSLKINSMSKHNIIHLDDVVDYKRTRKYASEQCTPFSFQRFFIPELCSYKGIALYLDSDMLFFNDVEKLFDYAITNKSIITANTKTAHTSVMLIDCASTKWIIEDVLEEMSSQNSKMNIDEYISNISYEIIDHKWNSLDFYKKGLTCNVHFTNMVKQPWLSGRHDLLSLWMSVLFSAIESNFIDYNIIDNEIKLGHVRPSIKYQCINKIKNYGKVPLWIKARDFFFIPPFFKNRIEM